MQKIFQELCQTYNRDNKLIESLWREVESKYSEPHRHYHTLAHLTSLYSVLLPLKREIQNWDIILFTLFYHDIIYNVFSKENEEKSAMFAQTQLLKLDIEERHIKKVITMILATKHHKKSYDNDTQIFLDADLSILGSENKNYYIYTQEIRKEYAHYDNEVYKKNRIQLIQSFLERDRIYLHPLFYEQYEEQAKVNLTNELYNYMN
ncbi:MAG: hypothetical protein K0U38_05270 [Epsilonproteobacteria bacterium]|nr:hypothetical protein [Campylobacterota bacterium]